MTAAVRLATGAGTRYWRAGPWYAMTVFGIAALAGFAPVLAGLLLKQLVDGLATTTPLAPSLIAWQLAGWASAGAVIAVAGPVARYCSRELSRRLELASTGELMRAVTADIGIQRLQEPSSQDRIRLAQQGGATGPSDLAGTGTEILRTVITVGGFGALLAGINPLAAGLICVSALPALVAQLRVSRHRVLATEATTAGRRRTVFYSSLLTDGRAAQEIRLLGLGSLLSLRLARTYSDAHAVDRRVDRIALHTDAVLAAAGVLIAAAAAAVTVFGIGGSPSSPGDLALVLASAAGLQGVLAGTVGQLSLLGQTLRLYKHFADLVAAGPVSSLPVKAAGPLLDGVELHDVWFRYPGAQAWALRGVSLRIPAQQAVALVGRNGCGKSTIVKLLGRLYEPDHGRITWDGTDIRELDPAQLRARVAVLFQDFMTYDLSAADNIAVGNVQHLDDQAAIAAAAGLAGIADTLERLPSGYQTMLSRHFAREDGSRANALLSGGQWQRIALARTLIRGTADLVILDEPSSGLDPEAEQAVHERVTAYRKGRTSLLISHRLNAVRAADVIVVLVDGEVAEQGSHASLMASGGHYAQLFQLQASGYLLPQGAQVES